MESMLQSHIRLGMAVNISSRTSNRIMNTKPAKEINEPEFETEVLRSAQPVVVAFLTGWSKPCLLIQPVLDEVAQACNGNAKIFKVNVDDNPNLGTWLPGFNPFPC